MLRAGLQPHPEEADGDDSSPQETPQVDWNAFGMLSALAVASAVVLGICIWEARMLHGHKVFVAISVTFWVLYILLLIHESLRSTPVWRASTSSHLVAGWGLGLPLMLWAMNDSGVPLMRGCPAVEGLIISCVNIFLDMLPMHCIMLQHLLFLAVATANMYAEYTLTRFLAALPVNLVVGPISCLLLSLAYAHKATPPRCPNPGTSALKAASSSVLAVSGIMAAAAAAISLLHAASAEWYLIQAIVAACAGASAAIAVTVLSAEGCSFSCPGFRIGNISLEALLHSISQEVVASLSAVFLAIRFVMLVTSYATGTIVGASPTIDMLTIMMGIILGSRDIQHLQSFAESQQRAYKTVRALLCGLIPDHVAEAMEHDRAQNANHLGHENDQNGMSPRRESSKGLVRLAFRQHLEDDVVQQSEPSPRTSYLLRRSNSLFWKKRKPLALPGLQSIDLGVSSSQCSSGSLKLRVSESSGKSSVFERQARLMNYADSHPNVTVLFCDLEGFTSLCNKLQPSEVMSLLGELYQEYDELAQALQLYTVDIIGDCYMCAANLIKPQDHHVDIMLGFALALINITSRTIAPTKQPIACRVGMHCGPVISGILGSHSIKFTIIGDSVNVASRMESMAPSNKLLMSEDTYKQLRSPDVAAAVVAGAARIAVAADGGGFDQDVFKDEVVSGLRSFFSIGEGRTGAEKLSSAKTDSAFELGASIWRFSNDLEASGQLRKVENKMEGSKSWDEGIYCAGGGGKRSASTGALVQYGSISGENDTLHKPGQDGGSYGMAANGGEAGDCVHPPGQHGSNEWSSMCTPSQTGSMHTPLSSSPVEVLGSTPCTVHPPHDPAHATASDQGEADPCGRDHTEGHHPWWAPCTLDVKGKGMMRAYVYAGPYGIEPFEE